MKLLTTKQAASALGIRSATLANWTTMGVLNPYRRGEQKPGCPNLYSDEDITYALLLRDMLHVGYRYSEIDEITLRADLDPDLGVQNIELPAKGRLIMSRVSTQGYRNLAKTLTRSTAENKSPWVRPQNPRPQSLAPPESPKIHAPQPNTPAYSSAPNKTTPETPLPKPLPQQST